MTESENPLMSFFSASEPNQGLAALLNAALDAMILMDHTGKVVELNQAAVDLFGFERDELIGQLLAPALIPEEEREAHAKGLARYLATNQSTYLGRRQEVQAQHKSGRLIQVELGVTRVPGTPALFLASLRDIADRLASAHALRSSEVRLSTLIAHLNAGVLLEDEDRSIVLTNQTFCDLFSIPVPPEALIGQDCSSSAEQSKVFFADPESFVAGVERTLREQVPVYNEPLLMAQGRSLERDYLPLFFDHQYRGHLWVYRDVTERQRTQRTLQRDTELASALASASQQFLNDSDIGQAFSQLLSSLLTLTESKYGFLGEVLRDPEGQPYIRTHALTNITWSEETRALWDQYAPNFIFTNLNSLFGAVLTSRQVVIANDPAGDPRRGGLPPGHPPLNHFLGLPIIRGGELIGMAGIANRPGGYDQAMVDYLQPFLYACSNIISAYQDTAGRAEAVRQLQALTHDLRRSNQALQEFASVASHDLKEPLRKIQAFGGRLKTREAARLSPEGQDYLMRMLSAAERMQTLIEDLLAYSRVTSKAQPFRPVDLRQLVEEVVEDLEGLLHASGGQVQVGALPTVPADALQLRQLFQNLIGNALKFAHPNTPPVVRVSEVAAEPNLVCIQVQDNGIGFEPEYAERIFEIFERLHGAGTYEGTGMGLAICRRIVERHGGAIHAQSTVGQGATFTVELPRQREEPA